MEKLISHIIKSLCSKDGYSALFKAAAALAGIALLAISQSGTFLYDKDLAAHKAKFSVEAKVKRPINQIDCTKTGDMQVDCFAAQHEMKTLYSTVELLNSVTTMSCKLGLVFAFLSVIGFVLSPFVETSANIRSGSQA